MGASISPIVACSGHFWPSHTHTYSYNSDQIYQGLGIAYEKVKCEFCDSVFVLSKDNNRCQNCGASHTNKFSY